MATIICKRNKFNVVYSYYDEAGKRHQKWEAFQTMPEAKQRKSEIEYKQQLGSFTIPTCNTLNELLKEYVSLYGKTKWAINGYSSNTGLIRHYIAPKLGELRLKEITPRVLEMFYQGLLKTPAVPLMTDKKYRQTGEVCAAADDSQNPQSSAQRFQTGAKMGTPRKEPCRVCNPPEIRNEGARHLGFSDAVPRD